MISAEEARGQTELSIASKDEIEIKCIEKQINDAINRGSNCINNDGCLSKTIKDELEKLGYKVYQGRQYNESYYSISW